MAQAADSRLCGGPEFCFEGAWAACAAAPERSPGTGLGAPSNSRREEGEVHRAIRSEKVPWGSKTPGVRCAESVLRAFVTRSPAAAERLPSEAPNSPQTDLVTGCEPWSIGHAAESASWPRVASPRSRARSRGLPAVGSGPSSGGAGEGLHRDRGRSRIGPAPHESVRAPSRRGLGGGGRPLGRVPAGAAPGPRELTLSVSSTAGRVHLRGPRPPPKLISLKPALLTASTVAATSP